MSQAEQKVAQYLGEAHASEVGLGERASVSDRDDPARLLPRRARGAPGRDAGARAPRPEALGASSSRSRSPVQVVVGFAETLIGQSLALGKTPLDLLAWVGR